MSSASEAIKYFWLAYCDLIKSQINGGAIGTDQAIFFSTTSTAGPPADKAALVPPEYTNSGIFAIADHMLDPTDLFYEATSDNSYIRSVIKYMYNVDLGGDPNPVILTALFEAQQAASALRIKANTELTNALADFKTQQSAGITGTSTFSEWAVTNAPDWNNAVNQLQAANGNVEQLTEKAYGPLAQLYNQDLNRLNAALTSLAPITGTNMPCSDMTPTDRQTIINNKNSGTPTPAPTGVYYRPEYTSPAYVNAVSDFEDEAVNPARKPQPHTITISQGQSVDEKSFGQTLVNGSTDWGFTDWFGYSSSSSSEDEYTSFGFSQTADNITLQMSWLDTRTVPIQSGQWDIGNPKNTYKLKADAPKDVRVLCRPTELLVACNVSYTLTFKDIDMTSTFDQTYRKLAQEGGSFRIFGITIGPSDTSTSSTTTTTHYSHWDNASGTLTVYPTPDAGFATILAVVGTKVETI